MLAFLTFRHNIACKHKFVSSCVRDECSLSEVD